MRRGRRRAGAGTAALTRRLRSPTPPLSYCGSSCALAFSNSASVSAPCLCSVESRSSSSSDAEPCVPAAWRTYASKRVLLLALRVERALVDSTAARDQVDQATDHRQDEDGQAPECLGAARQVVAAEDVSEDVEQQDEPGEEQGDLENGQESVAEGVSGKCEHLRRNHMSSGGRGLDSLRWKWTSGRTSPVRGVTSENGGLNRLWPSSSTRTMSTSRGAASSSIRTLRAQRDGDLAELLAAKYGMSVEQARASQEQLTQTAAAEGLEFRFDIARSGLTFDGHRVIHLAAAHGRADAMKERLLRAYFTEGELIADHETLVRMASEVGISEAGDPRGSGRQAVRRRGPRRRGDRPAARDRGGADVRRQPQARDVRRQPARPAAGAAAPGLGAGSRRRRSSTRARPAAPTAADASGGG